MSNVWAIVGVALLLWVGWDLYYGYTLIHDWVYRDQQPTLYWMGIAIWSALAFSCFFSKGSSVWELLE